MDVGSLELIRPRSVGVEHVGLWAMERLGLEALLERLGFNGTQRAFAMASVIARMAAPGSERASWRWLCERSALGELLGVDFERVSMMRLYRVSDALVSHSASAGRRADSARTRRQSRPANSASNWAWLSDITPSRMAGQTKRCSSSRL